MDRRERGVRGETLAADLLTQRGWAIVGRNVRCGGGEIDLVARQGEEYVFVEVRTRRRGGLATPEESVDPRKQARLRRAAEAYMGQNGKLDHPWRIDVVAVELDPAGRVCRLEHFPYAL